MNTISDQLGIDSIEIIYELDNQLYHYIEFDLIDGKKWYYFVKKNNNIILYENSTGTNLLINNNIIIL